MKDVAPWIAIYAALLSTASAMWQLASYALTGGRAKVQLRAGAMSSSGSMLTMPPGDFTPRVLDELRTQGYLHLIVAVQVANVGRQPVTVAKWSLLHARGTAYVPLSASIGKPLPFRLEVGESETWAVDLGTVHAFVETTELTITSRHGRGVSGVVELADGRSRRSKGVLHLT